MEEQRQVLGRSVIELHGAQFGHGAPRRDVLRVAPAQVDHSAAWIQSKDLLIEGSDKVAVLPRGKQVRGTAAQLAVSLGLNSVSTKCTPYGNGLMDSLFSGDKKSPKVGASGICW
jgi:hypothetical protein